MVDLDGFTVGLLEENARLRSEIERLRKLKPRGRPRIVMGGTMRQILDLLPAGRKLSVTDICDELKVQRSSGWQSLQRLMIMDVVGRERLPHQGGRGLGSSKYVYFRKAAIVE